MEKQLAILMLALATNELLHNVAEITGIRGKVTRLTAFIDKKPYKELPLNINTRAKSYAISTILFIVVVSVLYGLYNLLNVSTLAAIQLTVGLLVASYIATAVLVDKYHVDIERVTRRFKP